MYKSVSKIKCKVNVNVARLLLLNEWILCKSCEVTRCLCACRCIHEVARPGQVSPGGPVPVCAHAVVPVCTRSAGVTEVSPPPHSQALMSLKYVARYILLALMDYYFCLCLYCWCLQCCCCYVITPHISQGTCFHLSYERRIFWISTC